MRRTGSATRLTRCPEVSQVKREINYLRNLTFHSRLGTHRAWGFGHAFGTYTI